MEDQSIDLSINKTKRKFCPSFNLYNEDSAVLSGKRKCMDVAPEQYFAEDKSLSVGLDTPSASSSSNPGSSSQSPDYNNKLTETSFINAAKSGSNDARFLWTSDKTRVLIESMLDYKKSMSYQGLNFQSNLFNFYSEIRNRMALLYPEDDFGPPLPLDRPTDKFGRVYTYRSKIELPSNMSEGYHRIKNKIKSLRNGLVRAKVKKSFKGMNKSVVEFYDQLNDLFGDCHEPLPSSKVADNAAPNAEPRTDGGAAHFHPVFAGVYNDSGNPWTAHTQERLMQASACSLNLQHSFYNLTLANTAVIVQCVEAINKALRVISTHAHKLHERACFMANFVKVVQQSSSQAGFSGWRDGERNVASPDDDGANAVSDQNI